MKILEITRQSSPTSPERGYADTMIVYEGTDPLVIFPCSSCPNPFKPSTLDPWQNVYALLDYGEMTGECVQHEKYGKCILINNGGEVKTINNNINQDGKRIAKEVFIHAGGGKDKAEWRGSSGCITLNPVEFAALMSVFDVGDKCSVEIIHS
jgi:hypothetical protein